MFSEKIESAFHHYFEQSILSIDSHVGGEPARLIVGGLPEIPGQSINDKRLYFSEHLDDIRRRLTHEPRGHRDMFASILTPPETEEAAFGLVYMDTKRYPYLCGHATMAAVSSLIELELLEAQIPETRVLVDTPSGPWKTMAKVRQISDKIGRRYRVDSVTVSPEVAFAYLIDHPLEVPGIGRILVDVSFTGGFFIMVSSAEIGLELTVANTAELSKLGMAIIDAGNDQIKVEHPLRPYINTIDVVEFYDAQNHARGRGKNFVIVGEGHIDRSPCGTGTCAKLALLFRKGEIAVGERFINEGLMGTTFEGKIIQETSVEHIPAVIPQVSGKAFVTGLHHFVLTPDDPLPKGFLL